jgi:hypothetical protein
VTESGIAPPKGNLRTLIRSQARRSVKPKGLVAPATGNDANTRDTRVSRLVRIRKVAPSLADNWESNNEYTIHNPLAGNGDTFDVLPVNCNGHMMDLLDHCESTSGH